MKNSTKNDVQSETDVATSEAKPKRKQFNAQNVAMAIHAYHAHRTHLQPKWKELNDKFGVCSSTFNNYKHLWESCKIEQLPRAQQLPVLTDAVVNQRNGNRGGNYYLKHSEEQPLLRWIINASERGRPFTGIQIRRMAAAVKNVSRTSISSDHTSSSQSNSISSSSPSNNLSADALSIPSALPTVSESNVESRPSITPTMLSGQSSDPLLTSITSKPTLGDCEIDEESSSIIEDIHSIDSSNIAKGTPCYHWFKNFLIRYKSLIQKKSLKSRSAARYRAEDAERIRVWFEEVYMPAIKKWNIEHPDQILAMDETGLLDNAELHSNVQYVCAKGVNKHLEERGSNARYSVLHICSALGVTLPPITIFQGSRMRVGMLEKAPKGTKYQFQESGYFLSDFLIDVVRHIIKNHQVDIPQTAVTSDPRVWVDKDQQPHIELTKTRTWHRILLMDNASTHRNIEAEKLAEANNLHIIYLPPNTTHFMQVSDVSVFSSMKKKWYSRLSIDAASAARFDADAAKTQIDLDGLTKQNFWKRFRPAWDFGTQPWRIIDGFKRTGQWPPNVNEPLKAIPSLKHEQQDPLLSAIYDHNLQVSTMKDENQRLARELAKSKREVKQLKSQLSNELSSNIDNSTTSQALDHDEDVQHEHCTSFDRITDVINQFTPPRKIQPRKASSAKRSSQFEIHATNVTDPKRLLDDDEANAAFEMQRLIRADQPVVHETIVKGDATAMGQAEANYLKGLIVDLCDARENLDAAKSAAKAKQLDKARAKRAAAKASESGKPTKKRKSKASTTTAGEESSSSSNKRRKTSKPSPPQQSSIDVLPAIDISTEEYQSMANLVRSSINRTPMTGAMRMRVNSIMRAKRSIDTWSDWKVVSSDVSWLRVRRRNDNRRTNRPIRRGLFDQESNQMTD